ncbi:hypothetical protein GCM10014719_53310 [Planomonospora parontospora subsp. antibiotica]|nr:hypothetical protein GCM10014719_53310 [Planomonospora parontospora subsp. antibiotica]GII13830.1 hypothetical protein Ppa05_05560 [Planomonospora parontospora subsp. antibiotica]
MSRERAADGLADGGARPPAEGAPEFRARVAEGAPEFRARVAGRSAGGRLGSRGPAPGERARPVRGAAGGTPGNSRCGHR